MAWSIAISTKLFDKHNIPIIIEENDVHVYKDILCCKTFLKVFFSCYYLRNKKFFFYIIL